MGPRLAVVSAAGVLFALLAGPAAAAPPRSTTPELSVTDRLADRRYVAVGDRAYVVGTQAGRFPAMGFHTLGEMGGVWSPPIKLLDGLWFGVNGEWLPPARRFASGYGYVRMRVPGPGGLRVERTEFAPDGRRAVLVGLELAGGDLDRRVTLSVAAHSELMGAYPWAETSPSQLEVNLYDRVRVRAGQLEFRDRGTPPVAHASPHDWAALVGSSLTPIRQATGRGFRGPQSPPRVCPAPGGDVPTPERCDDSGFGRGAGGRLDYRVTVPAEGSRTVWFAVSGSHRGPAAARRQHRAALADPAGLLEAKVAARAALRERSRLRIPGDPLLAEGIDWSKQNLADSVQTATSLRIRETNAGTVYPAPEGRLARMRFLGAGWPDYPWLFGTDGEYTAFAGVAVGQFEPIKDHLRALRDVSRIDNGATGKVVHEVVTDGSVYFGSNADEGNTDETAKFPTAVALLWRWTGDDAFRDEMYRFCVRGMRHLVEELDADGDGWPEGLGNVERPGMGPETLDSTVYTITGLRDLADLARGKGDDATRRWAARHARGLERRFERAWWTPRVATYADSLAGPGNAKVAQRHWIGVTPMSVETWRGGLLSPGLADPAHAHPALDLRETPCYGNGFGLYHTGAPGCDPLGRTGPPEQQPFTLNTAIMAVAEGNYGRLGAAAQRRFTTANRRLQLPDFDEQPGAMPEIAPGPFNGPTIDRPFVERPMVLQAWGAYGTAWPVVHQQLGVSPSMGDGLLAVVPQLPPGSPRIRGDDIRVGDGTVDVRAAAGDGSYRTTVTVDASVDRLIMGHTLPAAADVADVTLDGRPVPFRVVMTNRGTEVTTGAAAPADTHRLVVTTAS